MDLDGIFTELISTRFSPLGTHCIKDLKLSGFCTTKSIPSKGIEEEVSWKASGNQRIDNITCL
jgi:hypothetical protein